MAQYDEDKEEEHLFSFPKQNVKTFRCLRKRLELILSRDPDRMEMEFRIEQIQKKYPSEPFDDFIAESSPGFQREQIQEKKYQECEMKECSQLLDSGRCYIVRDFDEKERNGGSVTVFHRLKLCKKCALWFIEVRREKEVRVAFINAGLKSNLELRFVQRQHVHCCVDCNAVPQLYESYARDVFYNAFDSGRYEKLCNNCVFHRSKVLLEASENFRDFLYFHQIRRNLRIFHNKSLFVKGGFFDVGRPNLPFLLTMDMRQPVQRESHFGYDSLGPRSFEEHMQRRFRRYCIGYDADLESNFCQDTTSDSESYESESFNL